MWADERSGMREYYDKKTKEMLAKQMRQAPHDCKLTEDHGCDCTDPDKAYDTWKDQMILSGQSNYH